MEYGRRTRRDRSAGRTSQTAFGPERLEGRLNPAGGLAGQYFDNVDFTSSKVMRTDATVNFDWGTSAPVAGVAPTTFSVRWTGRLTPTFTESHTFFVTADDGFRLWVDDTLVAARTESTASGVSSVAVPLVAGISVPIRLEYVQTSGTASVKLEWASPRMGRQLVPSSALDPATVVDDRGSILAERWTGIAGTAIESLTGSGDYPNRPAERTALLQFEIPAANVGDNYGTRIRGYLVPPMTGTYQLAIAGDDQVRLSLATGEDPATATVIASATAPTGFRVFDRFASQQSAGIALVAGRRYFIEALQKEGTGEDSLSVAWKRPGDAGFTIVPGDALVPYGTSATLPAESQILATLASGHSRLLAGPVRFAAANAASAADPLVGARRSAVLAWADTVAAWSVIDWVPDSTGTILNDAEALVGRVYLFGAAYRLTGNPDYADRLWQDLAGGLALADWNPGHFLDTAGMTHAMGVAYDWLHDYWTPTQRQQLLDAIVAKGLNPGLDAYASNQFFFTATTNNWGIVCNGGMTIGALAIAGENPSVASQILARAIPLTKSVAAHFTPDNGNWYEGAGYYNYSLRYLVPMMAALQSALGTDFGIAQTPGLAEAGAAAPLLTGPTGIAFNYSDADATRMTAGPSAMMWMASRFNRPADAWYARMYGEVTDPLNLLWYDPRGVGPGAAVAPTDAFFRGPEATTTFTGADAVTFRGGWDANATFVATKAGKLGDSHGNLDAGTFVLDALGQRWFHDLGRDDYGLPGYFNGTQRWTYYRTRAEGQNTLVINPGTGGGQTINASPPVVLYQSGAEGRTVIDLTSAYTGVTSVRRGIALIDGRRNVLVQDEIQAPTATPADIRWFAHVKLPASAVQIAPDGLSATLTQNGQRLWVKIVTAPAGATLSLVDATPLATSPNPVGQDPNSDYKKLSIRMTGVTNARLAVLFVPLSAGMASPAAMPVIKPLVAWADVANSAPTLNGIGGAMLPSLVGGAAAGSGVTVASLLITAAGASRVADADANAQRGVAVISADARYGSWQVSFDAGSSWQSLDAVTAKASRLVSVAPQNRIRFVPKAGYRGTIRNGLVLRAWDQTSGTESGTADTSANGGATAFSLATLGVGVTVA